MKVFISVDMEGVCGVVGLKETDSERGGDRYSTNRHLMTQEANAAIEGSLKAGATELVVADSHGDFDNLIPEELHESAALIRGHPRMSSMAHGLDASFDAAMFVGFHAMAGTPLAVIDHTYNGHIKSVEVNGRIVGETGINAYLAGYHGVPVVFVTGDSAVASEAQGLIKGVHTVAVKEAIGAHAAKNLHPKRARENIRMEAEKALRDTGNIPPMIADKPVRMAVEFFESVDGDRTQITPGVTRVGATRIEFSTPDFLEAFRIFYTAETLSGI